MELIKFVRPSPVQFDPDQSLFQAVDIMIVREVSSAPVLLNEKIVGILHLAVAQKWTQQGENRQHKGLVKDAMHTDIIIYREGTKLEDALLENSSWFPAEDAQGIFAGIIMTKTLVIYLNKKLTTQSQCYQAVLENLPNGIVAINAEGQIETMNKAACNITELENISHQLASVKELNLELDAIIESSYDGIAISDHEGRGIRINQAHARLTGLDASHFVGKHIDDLFEKGIFQYE